MIIIRPGSGLALPLKTGQTTQYGGYADDGSLEKGLSKQYSILTTGRYSGTTSIDLPHLTRSDISFAGQSIICLGQMGIFKDGGGQVIVVSGSVSNDGVYKTTSRNSDVVAVAETLVNEGAGATVTISIREAHSNNCVYDRRTRLMWSRYVPASLGPSNNGKLAWATNAVGEGIFAYVAQAIAASLAGYTDWRAANFNELMGLIDHELNPPTPDTTAFPSGWNGNLWVSTYRKNQNKPNVVYTGGGANLVGSDATTGTNYVALVRGGRP